MYIKLVHKCLHFLKANDARPIESVRKWGQFAELLAEKTDKLRESRNHFVDKLKGGKPAIIFGASISNAPKYFPPINESNENEQTNYGMDYGLPLFIVKCIKKIDTMIKTDGLYRINGNFVEVEQLRYAFFLECLRVTFNSLKILWMLILNDKWH